MNNTLLLAATMALAIGTSYVVAQTATHPSNPPPTETPPPTDTPMSPRSNMPTTGPQSMTPSTPPDFATLDPTSQGYITEQQAMSNQWLRTRFASCDANHNGQVTRQEYMACTTKMSRP
jgi:hypothetical protein